MPGFGPTGGFALLSGPDWFDYTFGGGGSSSDAALSDRWYLARFVGQRSSISGVGARHLYRPDICRSSNSSSSNSAAKIFGVGRLVTNEWAGRPLYKVGGSYASGLSYRPPVPAGSERGWGRLVGSRSSFVSNSSLMSGRNLYAAKRPCKGTVPSSFSSTSSRSAGSFSLTLPCCGDRHVYPNQFQIHVEILSGTCTAFLGFDGMIIEYSELNNPDGWYFNPAWAAGEMRATLFCPSISAGNFWELLLFAPDPTWNSLGEFQCNNGFWWGYLSTVFAAPGSVDCDDLIFQTELDFTQSTFGFATNNCCEPGTTTRYRITIAPV